MCAQPDDVDVSRRRRSLIVVAVAQSDYIAARFASFTLSMRRRLSSRCEQLLERANIPGARRWTPRKTAWVSATIHAFVVSIIYALSLTVDVTLTLPRMSQLYVVVIRAVHNYAQVEHAHSVQNSLAELGRKFGALNILSSPPFFPILPSLSRLSEAVFLLRYSCRFIKFRVLGHEMSRDKLIFRPLSVRVKTTKMLHIFCAKC